MNKEYRQLKSLLKLLDREERWFTFARGGKRAGHIGQIRPQDRRVRRPPAAPSMQIEVSRGKGIMFRRDRHGTSIQGSFGTAASGNALFPPDAAVVQCMTAKPPPRR
ncbi:hypothetical protein VQ056_03280 [Paenibacillus sp. JTLBN-2024]